MGAVAGAEQLRRLLHAVMALGSGPDLSTVLDRIVELATDLVDARYGALGVLDPSRTHLAEFVTTGVDDATAASIGPPPQGHGLLGRLIVDRKPVRLRDVAEHPHSYGFTPHHPKMRSFLGVPIWVGDQVFGNLYLTEKRGGGEFTAVDEELAVGLAAAAGVAIDNARLLERAQRLLVLEDRERIARDLHDTVIQRLFATGLLLQGAARLTDRPEVADRLARAVDDLDVTVRHIRSVIFELQPAHHGDRSVRRDLLLVAGEHARPLGFDPDVRFDGPIDTTVDAEVAEDLVNVLSEALSNVARHAGATRVDVEVVAGDDGVRLTLTDDGRGIGVAGGRDGPGRGLRNLRERAERHGGTLEVGPAPSGRGTRLTWSAPSPA